MNSKLGKTGMQEALSVTAAAACASALFTSDSAGLYTNGNAAYITLPLSAAFTLLVFLLMERAMHRTKSESLHALVRLGLGKQGARIGGMVFVCLLVSAAGSLLERFSLMLVRFVFPHVRETDILLYLLMALFLLAFVGLEGVARTARLLAWPLLFVLLGAFAFSGHSYETHRLAPFPFGDAMRMLTGGLRDTALFFPAMTAVLIVAPGFHGMRYAKKTGVCAGVLSGLLSALSSLCLGMMYPYMDLAGMHSPMYRLTMGLRTGGYFPRLDLLLLFGWLLGGIIGAAFYIYAAALLFSEVFSLADIRPGIALFSVGAAVKALFAHRGLSFVEEANALFSANGFWLYVLLLFIAAAAALMRNRRREER